MADLKSLAPTLLDLVQCLLRDTAALMHDSMERGLKQDFSTIRSRVSAEGLSFFTKTLPLFGKHLDYSLEYQVWRPIAGFARRRRGPLPKLFGGLVSLVFSESDGSLLSNPSTDAIWCIRQLAYAFYKLEFPLTEQQVGASVESYVKTDAALPEGTESVGQFPLRTRVLLSGARLVVERLLAQFDYRDILPRHGPGAVATGENRERKWVFSRFYKRLHEVYPYYEYFVGCRSQFLDDGRAVWFSRKRELEGVSKYTLVPKDSRGPRGISMEPLEYQFIQQGIFRKMKVFLESHPLSRGHICFTDQTVNQRLAMSSSISRRYATVDMKDASDRVSLWLVRTLFSGCPGLLRALEATRSAKTLLPDGRTISLRKFAPMGSALCFPIEAVVFFSLLVSEEMLENDLTLEEACRKVFVYGDDIVCRPDTYLAASRDFPILGLRINSGKSYYRGFFRESCGVDAYCGVDVTPLRFRHLLSERGTLGPKQIASLVALRNSLYTKSCFATCAYLDNLLESALGPLPRCPVGARWGGLALFSHKAGRILADRVRSRYNHHLQRREILAWQVIPATRRSSFTGWLAIQQFLHHGGVPDQVPAGSSSASILRRKRKWLGDDYTT